MTSIFSEHLFSRTLFGGPLVADVDADEKKVPTYFLYRVVGDGVRVSELQFLEECRLLDDVAEPYSQAWIQDRYGAGTYRVMMTAGGPPIEVRRIMITPPSGDVPAELPDSTVDAMPLDVLQQMLLSAADPRARDYPALTSRLGREIAGGWMTTVRLLDDEGHASHPWRRLMPLFQEYSDSDIYRAYVARGILTDRESLRGHVLDGISMVRVVCERYSLRNWDKTKEHQGTWHLWLDDERDPKVVLAPDNGDEALGERYRQYVDAALVDVDWRWAKSVDEAIALVEEYGYPKVMGLDHDLGAGATTMKFIRWLADGGYHVPGWFVHSANPVGAENIAAFMRSWSRSIVPAPEEKLPTPEQLRELSASLRLDEELDEEDEPLGDVDLNPTAMDDLDEDVESAGRARGEA